MDLLLRMLTCIEPQQLRQDVLNVGSAAAALQCKEPRLLTDSLSNKWGKLFLNSAGRHRLLITFKELKYLHYNNNKIVISTFMLALNLMPVTCLKQRQRNSGSWWGVQEHWFNPLLRHTAVPGVSWANAKCSAEPAGMVHLPYRRSTEAGWLRLLLLLLLHSCSM